MARNFSLPPSEQSFDSLQSLTVQSWHERPSSGASTVSLELHLEPSSDLQTSPLLPPARLHQTGSQPDLALAHFPPKVKEDVVFLFPSKRISTYRTQRRVSSLSPSPRLTSAATFPLPSTATFKVRHWLQATGGGGTWKVPRENLCTRAKKGIVSEDPPPLRSCRACERRRGPVEQRQDL